MDLTLEQRDILINRLVEYADDFSGSDLDFLRNFYLQKMQEEYEEEYSDEELVEAYIELDGALPWENKDEEE